MATVRGAARFLLRGCRRAKMSSSAQADDPVIADLRIFSLTAGILDGPPARTMTRGECAPYTTLRSLYELRAVSLPRFAREDEYASLLNLDFARLRHRAPFFQVRCDEVPIGVADQRPDFEAHGVEATGESLVVHHVAERL